MQHGKENNYLLNSRRYILVLILLFFFTGCLKKKEKDAEQPQVVFSVTAASDTVELGEYAKIFAKLKEPYYRDKYSEIMVFMESSDSFPLKPDLSNEYDIDIAVFLNLEHDTINQKWVDNMDFGKTAIFGRKFSRKGRDTVRGYILEYLGRNPPIDDGALDSIEVKKYYFEKEIFVVSRKDTSQ